MMTALEIHLNGGEEEEESVIWSGNSLPLYMHIQA